MSPDSRKSQIAQSLRELVAAYSQLMNNLEHTLAVLCKELDLDETEFIRDALPRSSQSLPATHDPRYPQVDRRLLSVVWRGKTCFLGNSLPLRLFERLARRPNIYVSCEQLLSDVWRSTRSMTAIRSVVKELRQKLRAAGMDDLAEAIDGSEPGYYGLMIDRSK